MDHTEGLQLKAGTMVDHFKVRRLLGRGGMAEVYLAKDTKLGRKVALKVIHPRSLGSQEALERFLLEARTTARFSHPHIVTIFAVGESRGMPYVALEFLEGHTLRQRMERERLGLTEIQRLALAIARALREAHHHKVLHRDLKPENIVIPRDGRLRVLDFGLAKALSPAMASRGACLPHDLPSGDLSITLSLGERLTGAGQGIRGTPAYMAPEQWLSQDSTGAVDVWAWGVILFELTTGRYPFGEHESLAAICNRVIDGEPFPQVGTLADLPQELAGLIDRCLSKGAQDRPQAADLVQTMEHLLHRARGPIPQEREQNPFRGLLPFGEHHADLFFGREDEVATFVERLREEPLLSVVGPSGAGKSSFVQAGVVPRLREQGPWTVLTVRPGTQPFFTLASRLLGEERSITVRGTELAAYRADRVPSNQGRDQEELQEELLQRPELLSLMLLKLAEERGTRVLLIVDQLEELVTLGPEGVRGKFMQAICTAADDAFGPLRVIFTLRDDFLGRLAETPEAREAFSRVCLIRSPAPEALEEILVRPLEATGYVYQDPGLVREMIAAVRGEPAALALLQFACQMLWERRDRQAGALTRQAYEAIGGVAGALAQHADGVLEGLSPTQLRQARELLVRLITPDRTRRVLAQPPLLEGLDPDAGQVLARLVAARIVLARKARGHGAEAELELAHESLIHSWGRLARWIDDGQEEMVFLADLGQAADLWDRRGRREEEVWRGQALQEALWRRSQCSTPLATVPALFLEAGRRREQRRTRRKGNLIAAIMAVLALVALILAAQWREAERQKEHALEQQAQAQLEGARASLLHGDILGARAKLRGALELGDSSQGRALWWRLKRDPLVWAKELGANINDVAFSPDGLTVAAACQDKTIYLFHAQTLAVSILRGLPDQIFSLAFSPDGRHLASGTWSGPLGLWDLATGRLQTLAGHTAGVYGLSFSPDGQTLASAGMDGTVHLWDVPTASARAPLLTGQGGLHDIAFSPDGRLLATAGLNKTIHLWDVPSATEKGELTGHQGEILCLRFHPQGHLLASASRDGTIKLWDVGQAAPTRTLKGHESEVRDISFSPDGLILASGGSDKTLRLWDIGSGRLLNVLYGHTAEITGLAFSPQGGLLASSGYDKRILLWDATLGSQGRSVPGHRAPNFGVSFHPHGKTLASGSHDGTVRLWDTSSGEVTHVLKGPTSGVVDVAFSPDGQTLAAASRDQSIRLWQGQSQDQQRTLWGHKAWVWGLSFSPDGQILASGSYDRTVRLWNLAQGGEARVLSGHDAGVAAVSFSPDGKTLASAGWDQHIHLWDVASGKLRKRLQGHSGLVIGLSFSPDGQTLASGSEDGTVRLWDLKAMAGRVLTSPGARVYMLAFSPDGRSLGVPLSNGTALVIDLATQRTIRLLGHRGEVNWLRFSRDGHSIATTSDDETVRLWDASTGRPLWRAPALLPNPPLLLTHQGWLPLDGPAQAGAAWQRAIEEHATAAAQGKDILCLATAQGQLELWDMPGDRRLFGAPAPDVTRVLALPQGCLTLAGGQVRLWDRRGEAREILVGASALAWSQGVILAALSRHTVILTPEGHERARYPTQAGVTALGATGDYLVLGYRDGNMELIPRAGGPKPSFSFEAVPSSPVERIIEGPRGTIIAGYANGMVGLWNLDKGLQLDQARLHGPVVHLLLRDRKLFAATELGHHLVWDLGAFYQGYCDLVREVWDRVPVVWKEGLPALEPPGEGHPCWGGERLM